MPKTVSVVIPFYQKKSGLLKQAVLSVVNQSGDFLLQIIVVDDGSPIPARHELNDLFPRYSDKIILIEQKNAGADVARNRALDNLPAATDFVAFLDSDDEWVESHIERAIWALERGYDFYFSDFYQLNQEITAFDRAKRIDISGHKRIHETESIYEYHGDMLDQIIRGNILGTSTIVYNYRKFPLIRYAEGYPHTGHEYIFWIHLSVESERIAFSTLPECRYGAGVNIYADSGWGTNKYLEIAYDEIKYRKYIINNIDISHSQKSLLKRKINESRENFVKGFIHNLIHNRELQMPIFLNHMILDPLTLPSLLFAPMMIAYEKAKGRK